MDFHLNVKLFQVGKQKKRYDAEKQHIKKQIAQRWQESGRGIQGRGKKLFVVNGTGKQGYKCQKPEQTHQQDEAQDGECFVFALKHYREIPESGEYENDKSGNTQKYNKPGHKGPCFI